MLRLRLVFMDMLRTLVEFRLGGLAPGLIFWEVGEGLDVLHKGRVTANAERLEKRVVLKSLREDLPTN